MPDPDGGFCTVLRSIGSDFAKFQSECAVHKVHQPRSDLEWIYYQAGPTDEKEPIIFFHGTSGTAAAFFYQVQALGKKGYRVISAQYPAYNTPEEWCKGFDLFLDAMKCRAVHIFGTGLGGFLAQHVASRYPNRVRSLMLCNSFATTHAFASQAGTLVSVAPLMPSVLLRKVMLDAFPQGDGMELSAKQAVDWMAQQVNDLRGDDLASRLGLNCTPSTVGLLALDQRRITLLESNGETMVPEDLRRQLRGLYPDARVAQLKSGGDFPYLSCPDETTLFIEVHMRGVGVFPGGRGPDDMAAELAAAAAAAAAETLPKAPAFRPAPTSREASEVVAPPPRRAMWKNPFEDDPLL